MALATQCPHCYTCFRVANDQLKLHAGLVRCGACQRTFNGIEHLLAPGAKPKLAPAPSHTAPAVTDTVSAPSTAPTVPAVPPVSTEAKAELLAETAPAISSTTPPAAQMVDVPPEDIEASHETTPASHQVTSSNLDFDLDFENQFADQFEDQFAPLSDEDKHQKQDPKQEPKIDHPYSIDVDIDAWATVGNETSATVGADAELEDMPVSATQHDQQEEMADSFAEAVSDDDTSERDKNNEGAEGDESDDAEQETALAIEEDTPGFIVQAEKQKKYGRLWRILLWILTPLLVLSACAQASYLWRNELAAQLPQSKPWLTQTCAMLNTIKSCRISLPTEIEQILIESNELQAVADQANKPKLFALALQLQNHSSTAQTWPNIALTLNDQKDKAVIRRIFVPNDYLPIKTDPTIIGRGFAANAEQNIKLYFELEGVEAAGYQVGTYYP